VELMDMDPNWILTAAKKGNSYSQLHLALLCMTKSKIPSDFLINLTEDSFLKMNPNETRWSRYWIEKSIDQGNVHSEKIQSYLG
jgi:hypothetical protein